MQTEKPDSITTKELAWALEMVTPLHVDVWIFNYAQWEALRESEIKIDREEDRIFLRTRDLRCTGFGYQLNLAERARGWQVRGSSHNETLSDRLSEPTPGAQLLAAWGEVRRAGVSDN